MSRCGCDTATEVKGGCGIHLTGSGEAEDDPYVVALDPASAAGDGLRPAGQDCKLATKIVPGGGIDYDGNGAMYAADCVPEIDPSKPTVDGLIKNRCPQGDIVGGYLGGGYLYKPQSTQASIDYGAERGLDMIHLPVRMLADGTPAVTPDEYLGRQNGNVRDFGQDTPVQEQSPARWRRLVNDAGTWRPDIGADGQPHPEDPAAGWFGWLEPNEQGLLTLDRALDRIDNRAVTVIELQWPALRDENGIPLWQDGHAPPPGRVPHFLDHVKRAIRRRGSSEYSIVVSQWPYLPPPEPGQPPLDTLGPMQLRHTGPVLYTAADADRLANAPGWQVWNWTMAHRTVPADKIKPHTGDGHNAILFPITRHSDHERYVPPSGACAVLSGDPEYTAGHLKTNPGFGNHRYRKFTSSFHDSVIEHGLIAPGDEWGVDVHPNRRGLKPRYLADPAHPPNPDPRGQYDLGKDCFIQGQPGYWVLQGWISPIPKVRDTDETHQFDLSWWCKRGEKTWAEVLLARNTDKPFDSFEKTEDKSGYIVSFRGDQLVIACWDPGKNGVADLASLDTSKLANGWVAIRASVRDDGITVAVADRDSGQPLQDPAPYQSAQDPDQNKKRLGSKESGNRGGYVFFARTLPDNTGGDQPPPDQGGGQPPPPPDQGGGQPAPPPNQGNPPPAPPPPNEPGPAPPPETYVAKRGDTLSSIAQKTNSDPKAIQDANGIQDPNKIAEGQALKIPR